MAVLDLIEFFDQSGKVIVTRVPSIGSGEFRLGSQLIVQESQIAVFYSDGQALDQFEAGRHKLSTRNLPLLGSVIKLPFGGFSPFRCYVYFVATKTFINLGWGTRSPILFRDTDFRMINLRAYGAYSLRIVKPKVFLNTLVGTRGMETTDALEDFFRTIIASRLTEAIGSTMKSILDLASQYNAIALKTKEAVANDFEQYGIQLVDVLIQAITPPPEVQAAMNRASGVAAQDTEKYRAITAADAMLDAASNPGGVAGEGMGAGVGLAMGFGMAQQMGQMMTPSRAQVIGTQEPYPATKQQLSPEQVMAKLKALKELQGNGLISDTDFEEQKRRILEAL